jgi:hypothetical protein
VFFLADVDTSEAYLFAQQLQVTTYPTIFIIDTSRGNSLSIIDFFSSVFDENEFFANLVRVVEQRLAQLETIQQQQYVDFNVSQLIIQALIIF